MNEQRQADLRDEIILSEREQREQLSIAAHSNTICKRIITRLCPGVSIDSIRSRMPDGKLDLELLPALIPGFPLKLAAERADWLHTLSAADLLAGNLLNTTIFHKYLKQLESRGLDDRKCFFGLVSPWPGATAVVFHNWPHKDETVDQHAAHGKFLFVSSKKRTPILYVMEPLDALLTSVLKSGVLG